MMIYDQLPIYLDSNPGLKQKHPYLSDDYASWTNKHYVALSKILDLSQSFVKRLFEYSGHYSSNNFNKNTKEKLLQYFGIEQWAELEEIIIRKANIQAGNKKEKIDFLKEELLQIQLKIKNLYDLL